MARDRLSVVLAAMASVDGAAASVIDRVCVAAVMLLGLSGAGVSLMVDGELRGSAGVSESGVAAIQELQLSLGEGPCVDAWSQCEPVLEPDLAAPEVDRWQSFARVAVEAGVRAVFAFPLALGAIRIGVLVLYRNHPGALDGEELAQGLVLADVASQVVLAVQAGAPDGAVHELLAGEPAHWAEVHQATGMVAVQLGVSMDEAFVRLRARAFGDGRPLRDLAGDVVARRCRIGSSE
ncbi:MAG: GAF and ANTAR domain-containing protein [Solirubrobacteraceae bacterium]